MQGELQMPEVEGVVIERILLAGNKDIYSFKFNDQSSTVTCILTREQMRELYKATLNYQSGMPGYQGMKDKTVF